jgi:hypothetical protein
LSGFSPVETTHVATWDVGEKDRGVTDIATLGFIGGFILMMLLDVGLG